MRSVFEPWSTAPSCFDCAEHSPAPGGGLRGAAAGGGGRPQLRLGDLRLGAPPASGGAAAELCPVRQAGRPSRRWRGRAAGSGSATAEPRTGATARWRPKWPGGAGAAGGRRCGRRPCRAAGRSTAPAGGGPAGHRCRRGGLRGAGPGAAARAAGALAADAGLRPGAWPNGAGGSRPWPRRWVCRWSQTAETAAPGPAGRRRRCGRD